MSKRLAACVSALLIPGVAHAEAGGSVDEPPIRFELTMGFAVGYRDHRALGLSGDGVPVQVFERAPYDGALLAGLTYDLRLVFGVVRMGIGGDALFAGSRSDPESRTSSFYSIDMRAALGLEHDLGGVTPFVDLVGTLYFPHARVSIDGTDHDVGALGFGMALRVGARFAVYDGFFAQASLIGGFLGPLYLGGDLAVGFVL